MGPVSGGNGMVTCIQCRHALDQQTNANGMVASCDACEIEHYSLGRLMQLADSQLTTRIWNLIQTPNLAAGWKVAGKCPCCRHDTHGVPFRHEGKDHALIACAKCYLVAMKRPTLQLFRESNAAYRERQMLEARRESREKLENDLRKDIRIAKQIVRIGMDKAGYALSEGPLREIRVTVLVAAFAIFLSLFTMLLPYTSLELFGSATSASLLALLTHVTFFQLAWNLLFFLPLGAAAEREMGSVRYAITFGVIFIFAHALGRMISPFSDAAVVGLSPLVAALIGRNLVLGIPLRARYVFEMRTVAFVFGLSEFRTMIPTSGGMQWFTLGACLVAGVLAAAVAEWQRRRTIENANLRRDIVVIPDSTRAIARRSGELTASKKAA